MNSNDYNPSLFRSESSINLSNSQALPVDESTNNDDEMDHSNNAETSVVEQNACEHQYLGELEQVRGRVIMDDFSIQKIPLLFSTTQVTIVPGQSFPVMETEETAMNILKYAMESDHIFGIIPAPDWDQQPSLTDVVGTTSEIIAYKSDDNCCTVRAVGRQRFRVLRIASETINENFIRFAHIKILPEISLQSVLEDVKLSSLNKFRISHKYRCLRKESSQMRWPAWLYRNHDEKYLVHALKTKLVEDFSLPKNIIYSDDPTTLSFQLLKTVAVSPKEVSKALRLNTAVQRLRWFLNTLDSSTNTGKLKCRNCSCTIGYCADIFAMSAEGPHGTYVNPSGCVHELITLKSTKHAFASRIRQTEYSWFPGYAWSVVQCQHCEIHLGWKFTACVNKDDVNLQEFWGILNESIEIVKKDKDPEKRRFTHVTRLPRGGPYYFTR